MAAITLATPSPERGGPKLGTWAGAARVGALRSVLSGPEGHYCCVRQMRSISPVILRRC